MCKPILTLLLSLAGCAGFNAYDDPDKPSRVTIRLVDENQPARGVAVRVVAPDSKPLGQAVTDDDGVADVELSRSGEAWLVVNTGEGRGTLVRFTASASGKNDLGERALTTLTEFPDLVTLREVGFEERLTASDEGFAEAFALAKDGVVVLEQLGAQGMRVLHHDFASGETKTLREVDASTSLSSIQVVEGVVAWWVEHGSGGPAVLQACDLRTGQLFPRFAPEGGFQLTHTLAWLVDGTRLQLALAVLNFNQLPWKYEGYSLELGGRSPTGVPLMSAASAQRFLWPAVADRTLWLRDFDTGRIVAFDVATFARRGEVQFTGPNQNLFPSNDCVLSSNTLGLWRALPGQAAEQLLPPSEDPLGWVLAGPPGEQRWLQGRLGGAATLVLVDCGATLTQYTAPAGSCGASCFLDAFSAPIIRVAEPSPVGQTQRRLSVKSWVLGQNEATPVWQSEPLLIANYTRGERPLLELSQAYTTVQLAVGVPGASGSFHTWLPASRSYPAVEGDRLVYLMRDPLTERQQVFVLRGTP